VSSYLLTGQHRYRCKGSSQDGFAGRLLWTLTTKLWTLSPSSRAIESCQRSSTPGRSTTWSLSGTVAWRPLCSQATT